MSFSPSVSYRIRPVAAVAAPPRLTAEQEEVVQNTAGRLRVLAGPGTGKTATLVEAVAERVQGRGAAADEILVLTFSRRAALDLSARISRRLGLTTRRSMVRTLHSYAYSIVRAQAQRCGEPAPRLLPAGESDQMVRELLAGHAADGGGQWPAHLTGALGSPTFAAELRELLLRAAGQGIPPQRMIEIGRRHKRPEWVAAGRFAREFQQVSDLRQGLSAAGVALDQAELTAAALGALRRDDVLAAEQRQVRRIFVDEYQDIDPGQAALISVLATGADELVVLGDPDQSIYAFRGSESTALRDVRVDRTVELTISRRLPAAVLLATRRVAARLPGPAVHRELRPAPDGSPAGEVVVKVFPTAAREAAYVADVFRRAHLVLGVPWSSMALLLRTPIGRTAALARACAVAGVPISMAGADGLLADDPVVAALLEVLAIGVDPALLTGEAALSLMASPVGNLDPLALRRVRRALRLSLPAQGSSPDLLASILLGASVPAAVPTELRPPLDRTRALLDIARAGASNPVAEQVLWQVWQSCGLEEQLLAAVERGGSTGQRADRSLDAVLALFGMAAELAERVALAGVTAFIDAVRGQQLPTAGAGTRSGDAVSIMSAHAAKGLEWDVVAVAGVQEGSWPDLRVRGSVLSGRLLLDLGAELAPAGAPTATLLADERRLFYVAATRTRRMLVCTAVQDQDTTPSRFLAELAGIPEVEIERALGTADRRLEARGLHLTDLVADLRRAVTNPGADPDGAAAAARHLAELADAGVAGAHPDDWYGLAPRSSAASPVQQGAPISVSPSLIESLTSCALRAVLERRGGRTESGQAQIEGIVVHAMAHGLALGVPETVLRAEIDEFLAGQDRLPPWQLQRTRRGLLAMLAAAQIWVRDNHPPRTMLGSELAIELRIPAVGAESEPHPVRLVGRVDWLARNPDGTVVITDFKTGATVPTKAQAQGNPQLAAYQVAVALGAFAALDDESTPVEDLARPVAVQGAAGGAELVFLRSGQPKVLRQDALSAEATTTWLGAIGSAAAALAAGTALATENLRCERCPVRTSCPLQNEGRQVTR